MTDLKPRYEMTDETKEINGHTLHRVLWLEDNREGGWLETTDSLPQNGTAILYSDATVYTDALVMGGTFIGGAFWDGMFMDGTFFGGTFFGGTFRDGEFRGGVFIGGVFRGGTFFGGTFRGGEFLGGEFLGGVFIGGVFRGGTFRDGEFRGGVFIGGVFRGGEFRSSPACAQRSDGYMFVVHAVDDELRVWAGCRNFSWNEALAHWSPPHKRSVESLRIIEFLKAQVKERKRHEGINSL